MVRYEVLMLAVPEITQDETKRLEQLLDETVNKQKGTVISFERWGKYRLAYPVKKNEYGVYFLARIEAPEIGNLISELDTLFKVKLHEIVMRKMITKLDAAQSLAYQRPQSLEEQPQQDVSSLISGSLKSSRRSERPSTERPTSDQDDEVEEVEVEEQEESVTLQPVVDPQQEQPIEAKGAGDDQEN